MTGTSARPDDRSPNLAPAGAGRARASLLAVGLLWGLNWPSVRLALQDLSPWAVRTVGLGCGALALFALARLRGRSVRVAGGRARLHVAVAGLLTVAGFNLCSAFAQLGTSTGRAAICAYTMPVWTILLARPVLGERLDRPRALALASGIAGLAVLLWPLLAARGLPLGVLFALGAALSWAAGTVYQKWARIEADPLALAAWQLATGAVVAAVGLLLSGTFLVAGPHLVPLLALAFTALFGTALGYLLWFGAVARLPAGTAGLGSLLAPVVGVTGSTLLLGERPSATDLCGFGLVILAALCALRSRPRDDGGAARPPLPRPGRGARPVA